MKNITSKHQRSLHNTCISIVIVVFLATTTLFSTVPGFVKSIKVLRINSLHQHVVDKTVFIFEGAVELLVDQKFHLWADRVEFDKKNETLLATKIDQGPVVLENNDFIILADRLFLDLKQKTGYADNISIHVDEGYLSASRAEKLNENDWCMRDMIYTPCDKEHMHWHFKAGRAVMHGSYFIGASNLLFNIGDATVFVLPRMVFPIQGRSKSGFLVPKFSYDYEFGFGAKQEYYWHIHRHCDTTLGFDWRERRGVVFSNEFRLARAPENYTLINSWYAIARNSFIQRGSEVVRATARRYWIAGKDFRSVDKAILNGDLSSLVRVDFGTDKKIGYTFFNSIDDVDDTFSNAWIVRNVWSKNLLELKMEDVKTFRKRFFDLSSQEQARLRPIFDKQAALIKTKKNWLYEKKEIEDSVGITYLPHVEWNTAYKNFGDFFSYRHDVFADHVLYRQWETEKFYFNSFLVDEQRVMPLNKTSMVRLCYRGNLHKAFRFQENSFKFWIHPHLQVRSQVAENKKSRRNVLEGDIFSHGAYRCFIDNGVEWAMPEFAVRNDNYTYMHYMQPVISWEYIPKFYQAHWFYIDRRDRTYPKNEVSFSLRNNVTIEPIQFDFNFTQGWDWYDQADIFPLRRGTNNDHILPFKCDLGFGSDFFNIAFCQEYEWRNFKLLQSEIYTQLDFEKFRLGVGYLFQNDNVRYHRDLLSTVPHFLTCNIAIPLSKHATVYYDSQFYSELGIDKTSSINVKPLLQRVRFDYDGHCWGFYLGFEQKQYRESGVDRAEKSIVFSFRLESLGSFAKKFKGVQSFKS